MLTDRERHRANVLEFLLRWLPAQDWDLCLPTHGTGHESYFARSRAGEYFIKLGVEPERYRVLSSLGAAPRLAAAGSLPDGTSLVIQEKIDGHIPSRQDFQQRLDQFAGVIRQVHQDQALQRCLPRRSFASFRLAGVDALARLEQRWSRFRHLVPGSSAFVDASLAELRTRMAAIQGDGLVASHNDPCNGNWLIAHDGRVFLLDYEAMAIDDPALDLGALLWWYYPPRMRPEFLSLAGYGRDAGITGRMQIRMAMHCLSIILPRAGSFDRFTAAHFEDSLEDFRAALAGAENPQGYAD